MFQGVGSWWPHSAGMGQTDTGVFRILRQLVLCGAADDVGGGLDLPGAFLYRPGVVDPQG